jgi:hypothetical protein
MLAASQFIQIFGPEHIGLIKKLVHQRRLAMVNMGDYRYIANIIRSHLNTSVSPRSGTQRPIEVYPLRLLRELSHEPRILPLFFVKVKIKILPLLLTGNTFLLFGLR